MKRIGRFFVSIPAVAVLASAPSARAEDEAVRQAKAISALKSRADDVEKACGAKVSVAIDFASFPADKLKRYSMSSWCGDTLYELKGLCRGPKTKAYIQKNVKAFRCVYAKDGGRKLVVEKGTLTMHVDFDSRNNGAFVRRQMIEKL